MVSQRLPLLLCSSVILTAVTVFAAEPCTGIYQSIASELSGFAEASSFCSSRYPVPATTSTIVLPTSTITSTIEGSTITVVVATTTSTVTDPQVTSFTTVTTDITTVTYSTEIETDVDTETDTEFTTITSTVVAGAAPSAAALKRAEQTPITPTTVSNTISVEKNAQPSMFSSCLAQPSTFVASVCTCLEMQPTIFSTTIPTSTVTVTVVPTANLTVTDTTTTTPVTTCPETAVSTESDVATTTTLTTLLTTTTSTQTATVTVSPPACPQSNNTQYVDSYGQSYNIYCNEDLPGNDFGPWTASSFADCIAQCSYYEGYCGAVTWVPDRDINCYPKIGYPTNFVQQSFECDSAIVTQWCPDC